VQESSKSKNIEKLMDYLKYRGCQVNMVSRDIAPANISLERKNEVLKPIETNR
jgi:hypothetical protein